MAISLYVSSFPASIASWKVGTVCLFISFVISTLIDVVTFSIAMVTNNYPSFSRLCHFVVIRRRWPSNFTGNFIFKAVITSTTLSVLLVMHVIPTLPPFFVFRVQILTADIPIKSFTYEFLSSPSSVRIFSDFLAIFVTVAKSDGSVDTSNFLSYGTKFSLNRFNIFTSWLQSAIWFLLYQQSILLMCIFSHS